MPETMGGGGGFVDYDGDGDADLLLVNGRLLGGMMYRGKPISSALYRNDGGGRFTDVTEPSGIGKTLLYGMGFAAADADGDGDVDLFLTAAIDGGRYLRNEGNGTFSDVTLAVGLGAPTWADPAGRQQRYWSTGAAWVDVDRDGWLDLFVANYVRWSEETEVNSALMPGKIGYASPKSYAGLPCTLYRNKGDGTFADVTDAAGIGAHTAKGLGVLADDIDRDGWPDLFVTSDTSPNLLFRNKGNGTFSEVALENGVAFDDAGTARAGMGVDSGDWPGDGSLGIAIGNFSGEPVSLFTRKQPASSFADLANRARVARPTTRSLTFGAVFFDWDLDGHLDLAIANGHVEREIALTGSGESFAQSPQLFRGDGTGRGFDEVTAAAGAAFADPIAGRALAVADIDGDGDLDLLLTGVGGRPRLLRNDGPAQPGRWIRFRLHDGQRNAQGIGARVELTSGGRQQHRWVRTGTSYLSQHELVASFGLGAASIESLRVVWADGAVQVLDPAAYPSGRTHTVTRAK